MLKGRPPRTPGAIFYQFDCLNEFHRHYLHQLGLTKNVGLSECDFLQEGNNADLLTIAAYRDISNAVHLGVYSDGKLR